MIDLSSLPDGWFVAAIKAELPIAGTETALNVVFGMKNEIARLETENKKLKATIEDMSRAIGVP